MPNRQRVNILLVDDQPANLLVMQTILGELDENLVCANSGEEALRCVLKMDFAVILLDVRMPTLNGFDTARLIRSRPRSSRVAILFITAALDAGFPVNEAYALGAVDYLTKPILPDVLRAKVSFFVDLFRKTEELAHLERIRHAAALNAKDERIRLILDNARDYAFIGTDLDGLITEWEGGAESITALRASDTLGLHLDRIFRLEHQDGKIFDLDMQNAEKNGRIETKRWYLSKDGKKFFADGVIVALKDDAGNLRGFAKIFRDATAERLAAENFRVSEERFSLMVNSSGEGIYGMALDRSCTFLNVAGAAMLGYEPGELVGKQIHSVIHHSHADGSHYPDQECLIAKATQAGSAARVHDEVFWHKNGTPISVSYSVAPMVVDGQVEGAVITFSDMTERKRAEDELRIVAAELSELDRRKTEFLATLAHELRNPLAPLRSGLEVMRLAADDPIAIAHSRKIMDRQLGLLIHLVDDLLDVSRITNDKIDLQKVRVELKDVVNTAVETSRPLIEAAGHDMSFDMPAESMLADIDPIRIAQVVSNLLNNAAKYTAPGGTIVLSVTRTGDELKITVTDSGIGIPEQSLSSIFDMFTQLKQNVYRAQGGLGIGLTLVRRLVELHGGRVYATSDGVNAGSTFNVILPGAVDVALDTGLIDQIGSAEVKESRLRILVVDDNVDAADTLATMLEAIGHTICVAYDGQQGIKTASGFAPDVIFLDIGMPGMNGYEVARVLRKDPDMEQVALIALTGWGTENDRARSQDAGFNFHLTKPASLDSVRMILAKLKQVPAAD